MTTATLHKLTKGFSQARYDRFVAQHVKAMNRSRAKGHRDWRGATDAAILEAAHSLARIYDAGVVWTEGPAL